MQSLFIQHWKAKRLGLSQLLARVRAGNHARGFSGYRGAHLCARSHEFFFGLLPSESGQCAGERADPAGERFFILFCFLSLAFRPMHPGGKIIALTGALPTLTREQAKEKLMTAG